MSRKQAPIIVRSIKEFVIQKGGRSEADLVEAEDNEHSKADDDHGNDLACLPAGGAVLARMKRMISTIVQSISINLSHLRERSSALAIRI